MGAPGFWDDQERAATTGAEHARANRRLEAFRSLSDDVEPLAELAELAEEDPSLGAELEGQVASVEARLFRARGAAPVRRSL